MNGFADVLLALCLCVNGHQAAVPMGGDDDCCSSLGILEYRLLLPHQARTGGMAFVVGHDAPLPQTVGRVQPSCVSQRCRKTVGSVSQRRTSRVLQRNIEVQRGKIEGNGGDSCGDDLRRSLAQSGRASGLGPEGRRFESVSSDLPGNEERLAVLPHRDAKGDTTAGYFVHVDLILVNHVIARYQTGTDRWGRPEHAWYRQSWASWWSLLWLPLPCGGLTVPAVWIDRGWIQLERTQVTRCTEGWCFETTLGINVISPTVLVIVSDYDVEMRWRAKSIYAPMRKP